MKIGLVIEDGTKFWYKDDKLHREDGPAAEYSNGTIFWLINDNLHREDGPAIEDSDGTKYWYINDIDITEEVVNWIKDSNYPTDYNLWTNEIKILFKMTFG